MRTLLRPGGGAEDRRDIPYGHLRLVGETDRAREELRSAVLNSLVMLAAAGGEAGSTTRMHRPKRQLVAPGMPAEEESSTTAETRLECRRTGTASGPKTRLTELESMPVDSEGAARDAGGRPAEGPAEAHSCLSLQTAAVEG